MPQPLLQVEGVTLQYETGQQLVRAAYRVSFNVQRSDRFVILGPSGCGKSTLLKSVGGYVRPVEGRILLDGKAIHAPGPDRIFIFQEFDQLLPWKTVEENIVFALTAAGKRARGEALERARFFLQKVNLSKFAKSYPHTLSGGMKQRAAIARALSMDPQMLLMDEPFAALDALTRVRMQEELIELCNESKATILFVTHSIPEAIRIGNRILLMSAHPGQVKAELFSPGAMETDVASKTLASRIEEILYEPKAAGGAMPENGSDIRHPEVLHDVSPNAFEIIERKRGLWEKCYGNTALRKAVLLVILAALWEFYARWRNNPLTFPTLSETVLALIASLRSGTLPRAVKFTMLMLLKGYGLGMLLAVALTAFASVSRIGADLLETLTSMFHPLPSIALLPIAFIWFGLGESGVIFVIVHAVLWSVALNTHAGFKAVSPTLRMVGRNYGLSTAGYISRILIPGAFPSILTGLKTGWAFAWRTLIAAELVFGASSESGGLGWYIFEHKNQLLIPDVFAGLLTVMILGLAVENLIFKAVEKRTVRRWGMES